MKSLGFNLARIDGLDWRYAEQNPNVLMPLWEGVAQNADSNGVATIYHFPNDRNKFPRSIVNQFSTGKDFWEAFWANSITYSGMSIWEAVFQGLWKPLIQTVDAHPSTLGYGLMNEPIFETATQLHDYHQFIAQRIRTLTSKVLCFSASGGGGGGSPQGIAAIAPPKNLGPLVFEGHNYQTTFDPTSEWVAGANLAGAIGVWYGEFNVKANGRSVSDPTLIADIEHFVKPCKKFNIAPTWYSWTSGGRTDLLNADNTPTGECQLLSQLYQQILGAPTW